MANKLFFSIEFVGGKATIDELAAVELELSGINKQLAAAKKAADGETYKRLRLEQENLKKTAKDLRAELVSTTREFEKAKFPTDSIVGMEHAYASLRREIREMSAEARNSAAGLQKLKFAESLKNQIDVTNRSIGDFKSSIGDYKSAFTGLGDLVTGGLITGGITAIAGALVNFGAASFQAFSESEKALTKVNTAIKQTGGVAGFTTEQLAAEAERLMDLTTFDDDQILNDVTAQLLTFTNVTGEAFTKAQEAALNLNTVLGGDLQGKAIQLGKALENPVKGLTALSKAGVTFTAVQKEQIKGLQEQGKLQEAQGIILDEINAKYGEQAKAIANTPTGKIEQMKNLWGELQEQIGGGIAGAVGKIIPLISTLITSSQRGINLMIEAVTPFWNILKELFNTIFEGGDATKLLAGYMEWLGRVWRSIFSILTTLISPLVDIVKWFRETSKESSLLGNTFQFLGIIISNFVQGIMSIPAALAGTFAAIKQFASNVKNLDFSKSIVGAGKAEFDRVQNGSGAGSEGTTAPPVGVFTPEQIKAAADKQAQAVAQANEKAEAKRKVEADKEAKRVQDQEIRIAKIKESIAELSAKEINNIFDKQIADAEAKAQKQEIALQDQKNKLEAKIKAQGGSVRGSDLTESGLIDQETAAIKTALDNQKGEIEKKRQEAFDAARAQLQKLQDENLKAIEANGVAVTEASLKAAELGYNQEEAALKTSLDKGLITHKAYDQMLLDLQKRRAEDELSIRENLLAERQAQLQLELQLELKHIDQVSAERKKAAQDEFNAGKVDAQTLQQQLLAIDQAAAEQKEAIMISTANKEKALIEENKNAQLEANKEIDAANKAVNDAELKRQKELADQKKAINKELSDALFNIAGQLSDAIFDINTQQAEKEKEIATTNLEDTYAKRIELAEGNATIQEALAKELEAKKLQLDKEAFEENKKRQISQAVINGLLGIVQSLANTVLPFPASLIAPGVIAATTAIQIAKIKGTTFAKGGFTGKGHGAPDHTGEIPVGVVHGDEYVVDKKSLQRNRGVIDFLEKDRLKHLRGFAEGGFTSDIIPQTVSARSFLTPNAGGFTTEMADEIAEKVYQATLAGSLEGSKRGTALGNDERNRLLEREKAAKINNTF